MDNVPLLRQAFDLLSYTVSPINSFSHLCLDDALTPECNILHADTKQMAWIAFQVVQIRRYPPLYNSRSCTVSISIVCYALVCFGFLFWFGFCCCCCFSIQNLNVDAGRFLTYSIEYGIQFPFLLSFLLPHYTHLITQAKWIENISDIPKNKTLRHLPSRSNLVVVLIAYILTQYL